MQSVESLRPLFLRLNTFGLDARMLADISRSYDFRIALARMLVHAGQVDGHFVPAEEARVHELLTGRMKLGAGDADDLLALVKLPALPKANYHKLLLLLAETLDAPGRVRFVEMLWDVSISDKHINASELALLDEVGELLGVQPAALDKIEARYREALDALRALPDPLASPPRANAGAA